MKLFINMSGNDENVEIKTRIMAKKLKVDRSRRVSARDKNRQEL